MAGYMYYGLALPGSMFVEEMEPGMRGLAIGFACGLLPLVAVFWMAVRRKDSR
jgi:hypothetical protein